MTVDELRASCHASIENRRALGIDGPAMVMLVLRGNWPRGGDRKRLFGRSGPLGRCVAETAPGRVLVEFEASAVLAAIEQHAGGGTGGENGR
jgi:hypothetical protein